MTDDGLEPGAGPVNRDAGQEPKNGPTYRLMLSVVIFLGVLIVVALGAVVGGLIMKMGGGGSAARETGFVLPAGAVIQSMEVSGNRLILRVKTDTGEEIDIVDTADGRLVAQVKSAPPSIPK